MEKLKDQDTTANVRVWRVDSVPEVICFHAQAILHHYGRHSHDSYSIGVIEAGVGGNRYRGETQLHPDRSIVVMNPDEVHTGSADKTPLTYRMFILRQPLFRVSCPKRRSPQL